MARKKKTDDFATVEDLAQEFFEREKAAYEERTGETVNYEPPTPLTKTPIETPAETETSESDQSDQESAHNADQGDGTNQTETEGDELS